MRKIKYMLMFPHSSKRKRLNDNNKSTGTRMNIQHTMMGLSDDDVAASETLSQKVKHKVKINHLLIN